MIRKHVQHSGVVSRDYQTDEMYTGRIHLAFAICLTVLAVSSGYLQYYTRPINCWCPAYFSGSMALYANSACYFNDRYYVPFSGLVPIPDPRQAQVNYFKWTPFALIFLATLYVIPEIIVNVISKMFRVNLGRFVELSHQSSFGNRESRDSAIQLMTVDLQSWLDDKKSRQKIVRHWLNTVSPSLPSYIRLRQIASKLIFVIGSIVPIIFLYKTLDTNSTVEDLFLSDKSTGNNQSYFPSVILCDFAIRQLQTIQRYTLQCHLPANDMFEKISVLVSFLALVVSSVSSSHFISCLASSLFKSRYSSYGKKHIALFRNLSAGYDRDICKAFVERYLTPDGLYLLHLIDQNSSEAVVSRILTGLWEGYTANFLEHKPAPPPYDGFDSPLLSNGEVTYMCLD